MSFRVKGAILVSGVTVFLVLGGACQQKPTQINEKTPEAWTRLAEKTKSPLKLTEDTVVLDARSDFDFGLGHWSGARHLGWMDFLAEAGKPGILAEPRSAARRLALLGIDPKTPVVVIGYGPKGAGEEGRLAWTLMYYGVESVQTVSVDGLDVYFTHDDTPTPQNKAPWVVDPHDDLVIDKDSVLKVMKSSAVGKHVFLIDVRSKGEFFNHDPADATPNIGALQIEWSEFFGGDGRPSKTIRRKLQGIGVHPDDQVILVSNHGTRSGAVTYGLLALGFRHAVNFLEGWDSLRKTGKK